MAALDFDINNNLHFPSLPLRYSTQKYTSTKPKYNYGFLLRSSPQEYTSTTPNYNSGFRMDDLNDTLLELIFERLYQWKHLATCKCVSKRWNSIISNPDFLRRLTLECLPLTFFVKSENTTLLFTEHPYFKTHKLCHNFLPRNQYDIVACHNDLLISFHRTSLDEASYYIANPLTKKFMVVPMTWSDTWEKEYYSRFPICLIGFTGVVDGVSTPGVTDLSNNNLGFRIVRVHHYTMVIYSSQTGEWKTVRLPYFDDFDQAVTWNNEVHLTSKSRILVIDPFDDDLAPRLLTLDYSIRIVDIVLGVCQNRLYIAGVSNPGSPTIEIWEFEDYEGDLITNKVAKLRSVVNFPLKRYLLNMFFTSNVTDDITTYKLPSVQMRDYVTRIICCHPTDPDVVYFSFGHMLLRCDVVRRTLKVLRRDWKFSSANQGLENSSAYQRFANSSAYQRFLLMSPLTM